MMRRHETDAAGCRLLEQAFSPGRVGAGITVPGAGEFVNLAKWRIASGRWPPEKIEASDGRIKRLPFLTKLRCVTMSTNLKEQRVNNILIISYQDSIHRQQVIALWKEVFAYDAPHNKPEVTIDKKLAINDELLFVAMDGENVAGTIMAGYDGHRGWIYSVAVAPSHRREGIGSQLVAHAERALVKLGCVKINLQIVEDNEAVTAFYASLGFSVEKRISMGKRIYL
jgi:ribosomal protein S18 acetylase RimI-like enzyme